MCLPPLFNGFLYWNKVRNAALNVWLAFNCNSSSELQLIFRSHALVKEMNNVCYQYKSGELKPSHMTLHLFCNIATIKHMREVNMLHLKLLFILCFSKMLPVSRYMWNRIPDCHSFYFFCLAHLTPVKWWHADSILTFCFKLPHLCFTGMLSQC